MPASRVSQLLPEPWVPTATPADQQALACKAVLFKDADTPPCLPHDAPGQSGGYVSRSMVQLESMDAPSKGRIPERTLLTRCDVGKEDRD